MKRLKRMPKDLNLLAHKVVQMSTQEQEGKGRTAGVIEFNTGKPLVATKNAAAVALGRLGGLKGGKARADRLGAERRSQIASQAARARWSKKLVP